MNMTQYNGKWNNTKNYKFNKQKLYESRKKTARARLELASF
jgi:hypothetical protein